MHSGDPSSLYIRPRHWENCFSSRAADTEKASPPPSRRHEILEFMQQRVKGGQALGHYDGCKAGDCHMYAHTSTEPYTDACMTNRLLSRQCTYTHPLFCLPPHAPVRPCVTCICLLYMPTGGNLRGTRGGSTHPDSTLRTRQGLHPAARDEAPERRPQKGCDMGRCSHDRCHCNIVAW